MSGVVKIEITELAETLKRLLINASTPQEKERIQTIYWLILFSRNGIISFFPNTESLDRTTQVLKEF